MQQNFQVGIRERAGGHSHGGPLEGAVVRAASSDSRSFPSVRCFLKVKRMANLVIFSCTIQVLAPKYLSLRSKALIRFKGAYFFGLVIQRQISKGSLCLASHLLRVGLNRARKNT